MQYNLSAISQDMSRNLTITVAREVFLGAVDIDMVPTQKRKKKSRKEKPIYKLLSRRGSISISGLASTLSMTAIGGATRG
jgi:hypothetical protein